MELLWQDKMGTEIEKSGGLKELKAIHHQMIDHMLYNPKCKPKDLAKIFDYSASRISVLVRDPLFRAEVLARRKEWVEDVRHGMKEKLLEGFDSALKRSKKILDNEVVRDADGNVLSGSSDKDANAAARNILEAMDLLAPDEGSKEQELPTIGNAQVNNFFQVTPDILAESNRRREKIIEQEAEKRVPPRMEAVGGERGDGDKEKGAGTGDGLEVLGKSEILVSED